MVDYALAAAAATIVATLVILATLLSRYNEAVQEADRSARLAKDVWDSMNSRFSVVDARIIDLMAKTEVLSSKSGAQITAQSRSSVGSTPSENVQARSDKQAETVKPSQYAPTKFGEGGETEMRVLRLLVEGPKSTVEIKGQVGRSREHTARLMKTLFDRGLVVRNDRNKPYVYEITERGKSYVAS